MKKKERFILGGLCFILLTMIFGPWAYNGYQNHQDKVKVSSSSSSKPSKSYTTTGSLKLPEYYTFGANNEYVITDDDALVGQDYILTFKRKLLDSSYDYRHRESGEYFKIAYQKIDGDSSSRQTVNLGKLANGYKKGYYLKRNTYVINYQGVDYLICFIGKDDSRDCSDWLALAYNLESGELTEAETTMQDVSTDLTYSTQDGFYEMSLHVPFWKTSLGDNVRNDHQSVGSNIHVVCSSDNNDITSINLFSENSSLQAQMDAGKDVYIYPRYNQVTPGMWFNDVLHWFAPSGQETLTVYMKDGSDTVKSTPITSYADYLALENEAASYSTSFLKTAAYKHK